MDDRGNVNGVVVAKLSQNAALLAVEASGSETDPTTEGPASAWTGFYRIKIGDFCDLDCSSSQAWCAAG